MATNIFQDTVNQIEKFYKKHHCYKLGWRFLTCSKAVLKNNPKIAFIALNPGGNKIRDDYPSDSCEEGNAYLYEKWKKNKEQGESPLQIQVRKMFDKICEKTNYEGSGGELLESSLSAYFVPFRSLDLDNLPHRKEAFDFGEKIWLKILKTIQPELFICIDKETAKRLRRIIGTAYGLPESGSCELPTGWGSYPADIIEFGANAEIKLLRLPHLSRFTLFTREASQEEIENIFSQFCG